MDEVSRLIDPGRGVWVDGEDVDMDRICCLSDEFARGLAWPGTDLFITDGWADGFTWV